MSAKGSGIPALEVVEARKRYGEVMALDGLSLTVAAGEWVALLGPNGAGKTTLMGAVAGLVRLDAGRVRVTGRESEGRRSPAAPAVGLVPQEIALYGALTARENLRAFGEMHGLGGAGLRQRVDWALGWSGLADRAESRVDTFSGGMKRRLNIACGVLHRPRVLLLDEPTVGVDPGGRRRIREMLRRLRRDGVAVVQSTHQLDEVEAICDRVLIVRRGRVVASGSLDELLRQTLQGTRTLRLLLDRPPEGLRLDDGYRVRGREVLGVLGDVAEELPALLERVRAIGARVQDLRVEAPGLEEVFDYLTRAEGA